MSLLVVARKDVRDALRARTLWAMAGVFFAVAALSVYLPALAFEDLTPDLALVFLATPVKVVAALTALVAGYAAIAGERDSGSIKVLLALPHTRREVVAGKFLGRGVVVSAALLIALGAVAAVLGLLVGGLPSEFGAFVLVTLLYGITFSAIAVGISAAVATRTRAAASAIGAFLLFDFLWKLLPRAAYYAAYGALPSGELPAWYLLLERLSPMSAYDAAVDPLLADLDRGVVLSAEGVETGGAAAPLTERLAGPAPFYLDDWFALVILALWLVAPLALGYLRFRAIDLA